MSSLKKKVGVEPVAVGRMISNQTAERGMNGLGLSNGRDPMV